MHTLCQKVLPLCWGQAFQLLGPCLQPAYCIRCLSRRLLDLLDAKHQTLLPQQLAISPGSGSLHVRILQDFQKAQNPFGAKLLSHKSDELVVMAIEESSQHGLEVLIRLELVLVQQAQNAVLLFLLDDLRELIRLLEEDCPIFTEETEGIQRELGFFWTLALQMQVVAMLLPIMLYLTDSIHKSMAQRLRDIMVEHAIVGEPPVTPVLKRSLCQAMGPVTSHTRSGSREREQQGSQWQSTHRR